MDILAQFREFQRLASLFKKRIEESEDLSESESEFDQSDGDDLGDLLWGESDETEDELDGSSELDGSFKQQYKGHCNLITCKDVSFFGPRSEYVMSGSDDGRIFIWEKDTAKLIHVLKGDEDIVNCVVGHPFDTVLASSGIENTVKIWRADATEQVCLKDLEKIISKNELDMEAGSRFHLIPSIFVSVMQTARPENESEQTAPSPDNNASDGSRGSMPDCSMQ